MIDYIASPYSSADPEVRHARYLEVMKFVAWKLSQSIVPVPFSPILYCHELARAHAMPTDAHFWLTFNTTVMESASSIIVLCLPGWEQSVGVTMEIKWARENEVPLLFARHKGTDSYELTSE